MVTIKDIAKKAGVNVSTVSRALSGSNEVGEETKKRIREIAEGLNYTPDFSARALVGKGTRLIGIIVPEITSNYYAQIVNCVEAELNVKGYNIMIGMTAFDSKKEIQNIEMFIGRKVDGIIFTSMVSDEVEAYLDKIVKRIRIPIVFLEPMKRLSRHDCILIDGEYGINLAVTHLIELGHRSIGFIGEDLSARFRLPAFKNVLLRNGLKYEERYVKSGVERFELGGYLRMKELLAKKDRPTAIFAAYDNIAIGAMKAAYEADLKIPGDISIVGYDDIRESGFLYSPLTTVFVPIIDMSVKGIRFLMDRIENRESYDARQIILKPQLVVRESTIRL